MSLVSAVVIATATVGDGTGGGTRKSYHTDTIARLNSPGTLRDFFLSSQRLKIAGRVKPATIFACSGST